ncbi:MAG TPA: ABC transporter substrate-binding protein [Vicinamibacteria bacterium]|nr:ABC transporter substrate-binding protein [Vicinamibacteria bacterium]
MPTGAGPKSLAALVILLAVGGCKTESVQQHDLEPIEKITLGTFTKNQYPLRYEEAILIAESWRQLGLDVQIEPVNFPNPVVERLFLTRDFDAFLVYFTPQLERLEPDFFTYNTFHSANAEAGGWNLSGFESEPFDRLAETQRREYSAERRKELVLQCQEALYSANPWIVTVNQDELQAYNKKRFRDPVLPRSGGFKDPSAFFTIQPTGDRSVVRLAVEWSGLKTVNPLLASESTQVRMLHFVYDTLVRLGADTQPRLWAATAITPIDEVTFDVTLRDDMYFHDGQLVTAEDVAFTFGFLAEYGAIYFRAAIDPIERTEVVETRKVRFHLRHPYAPFVGYTLALVPILPRHIWSRIDEPVSSANVPPIGSGPFKFGHWKETQEILLERFDGHFQPARVDGVLVIFFGTREAAFTALRRGDADVVDILMPHQLAELNELDHIQTVRLPSHAVDAVVFNLRRRPFSDAQFRLALAHATPRRQILDELFSGYGSLGAALIAPANEPWTHSGLEPHVYDLEKARKTLSDAGYRWDEQGRLCYGPRLE